jgi:uncharacterized protein YuzE
MAEPVLKYDELSDTLYISFAPGEKATGIELNDNLLLRINKAEQRAVGITIFDYSYLAQKTAAGVRSLPLTGLAALADELRTLVLAILQQSPVSEILGVSAYSPSVSETIPIATLHVDALAPA